MIQKFRKFLYSLSGVRPEILRQCPTERIKFESLGLAILITSSLATISMWFALTSAMGFNPFASVAPALVWGLIIMGIDRWLVTSMPPDGSRRLVIAIPRLALALLLGTLISTPFVLRIFQSEINAQITVMKQQRASAFLAQQEKSQVGQQVTYWRIDVANLQKVIDSGGEVPLNPSTDPQVQSLTKQRTAELALEQQYYHQWQCQLYGGAGCPAGNGPLAQASETSYHQAAAQVTSLTAQIRQRENQLSATDTASKKSRYQQANSALPAAQQELNAAVARQNTLQQNFDAKNEATNGLLIRLEALNQLSGNNFTVNSARLLLFLLFLVIECLPVTVKLLQQPGNYEKILQAAAERELNDAKRAYRNRPRTPTTASPNAGRTQERDVNMHEIWRPDEAVPPFAKSTAQTPKRSWSLVPDADPADSGEHSSVVDEMLRSMRDDRSVRNGRHARDDRPTIDADQRGGGIPLSYHDGDL
jgi:hypothetical protein